MEAYGGDFLQVYQIARLTHSSGSPANPHELDHSKLQSSAALTVTQLY